MQANTFFAKGISLRDQGYTLRKNGNEKAATQKFEEAIPFFKDAACLYLEEKYNLGNWLYIHNFISWRRSTEEEWRAVGSLSQFVLDSIWAHPRNENEDIQLCKVYTYHGKVFFNLGHFQEAKTFLEKTIDKFREKASQSQELNKVLQTKTHDLLGKCCYRMGEFQRAFVVSEKLSGYYLSDNNKNNPDPDFAANSRLLGSSALIQMRKYDKAINYCQAALTWKSLSDETRAGLKNNIGFAYLQKRQFDEALDCALEAIYTYQLLLITSGQSTVYKSKLESHLVAGLAYQGERDTTNARIHFEEAINSVRKYSKVLQKPEAIRGLVYLGNLYLEIGRPEIAIKKFHLALENGLPNYQEKDVWHIPDSSIYLSQNPFVVDALAGKARAILAVEEIRPTGHLAAALKGFELAINLEEAMRQSYVFRMDQFNFKAKYRSYYEQAMDVAFSLYMNSKDSQYLYRAFQFAEGSKASVLLESVRKSGAEDQMGIDRNLTRRIQNLSQYIEQQVAIGESSSQALVDSFTILNALRHQLSDDFPAYYGKVGSKSAYPPSKIQESVQNEGAGILEYFLTDKWVYVFFISRNDFELFRVEKSDEFNQRVLDFVYLVAEGFFIVEKRKEMSPLQYLQKFSNEASEFYDILIGSVLDSIAPTSKEKLTQLIIIPDQELSYLPFDVLVDETFRKMTIDTQSDPGSVYMELPYLFRTYTTRYAFSASMMMELSGVHTYPSQSYIGFAHNYKHDRHREIAEKNVTLDPIYQTQKQVVETASLFGGSYKINEEAQLEEFYHALSSFKIIQLFLHGESNAENDLDSWIAFANDSTSAYHPGGILYAKEIYPLLVKAGLVILSGCSTGTGQLQTGEGVMSLARAFIHSGAQSVVNTLWKSGDGTSSEIMGYFLKYIRQGWHKDKALQQAKMDYLENIPRYKLPCYWSHFILIGNNEPLFTARAQMTFSFESMGIMGTLVFLILVMVYLRRNRINPAR